jgi:hypothetical protein
MACLPMSTVPRWASTKNATALSGTAVADSNAQAAGKVAVSAFTPDQWRTKVGHADIARHRVAGPALATTVEIATLQTVAVWPLIRC